MRVFRILSIVAVMAIFLFPSDFLSARIYRRKAKEEIKDLTTEPYQRVENIAQKRLDDIKKRKKKDAEQRKKERRAARVLRKVDKAKRRKARKKALTPTEELFIKFTRKVSPTVVITPMERVSFFKDKASEEASKIKRLENELVLREKELSFWKKSRQQVNDKEDLSGVGRVTLLKNISKNIEKIEKNIAEVKKEKNVANKNLRRYSDLVENESRKEAKRVFEIRGSLEFSVDDYAKFGVTPEDLVKFQETKAAEKYPDVVEIVLDAEDEMRRSRLEESE